MQFTDALGLVLTEKPKVCNLLQGPSEVAAWLEAASIGVNVHMANRLLDPNAETQGAPREGVQDVHKVSIIWRETPVGVLPLKVRTSWVQTCRKTKKTVSPLITDPQSDQNARSQQDVQLNVMFQNYVLCLPVILPTLLVA